jgi:hypothetical protein
MYFHIYIHVILSRIVYHLKVITVQHVVRGSTVLSFYETSTRKSNQVVAVAQIDGKCHSK